MRTARLLALDVDIDGLIACADPECTGMAEPEVDGDHKYFACLACGFEFGYQKADTNLIPSSEGTCAIGVPESIRAAFSPPQEKKPVSLGLTIPLRS